MKRNIVIIALSIALLGVSLLALRPLWQAKPDQGLLALQEVRRIKELHLVSFRYEDIFFYHSKQDKGKRVVVMASVPVTLNAFFDMSEAEFNTHDSIMLIRLPLPQISEPNYQIDRMRVQSVRRFTLMAGVDLHKKLLEGLSNKIAERKPVIKKMAVDNGVEDLAFRQAEQYFQSFFKPLGFNQVKVETKGTIPGTLDTSLIQAPAQLPIDGIKIID